MKQRIVFIVCLLITLPLSIQAVKAVLGGGGLDDDNADVYNTFVSLSTPSDQEPYIGIITAASEDPAGSGDFYIGIFQNLSKVQNVEWLPIDVDHPERADDPALVAKLQKMTGVFFGGGDQTRLITCFFRNGREDTKTLAVIRQRFQSGDLAIGGTSAGTDIHQKAPMVTGGLSWDALAFGSFDHTDDDHTDDLSYDKDGGFGFFTYGFLDTHFGTRCRQGRMLRLLHDLPENGTFGVGIDENTAIAIVNNIFEVVGFNGVYILNTTKSRGSVSNSEPFYYDNIQITYLTKGDTYDMNDGTVTFASFKQDIHGREEHQYPISPTDDIFGSPYNEDSEGNRKNPEIFTNITVNLFDSAMTNITYGFTYEGTPQFRVDFTKTQDSAGAIGYLGQTPYISYKNLRASIKCSANCTSSGRDTSFLEKRHHHVKTLRDLERFSY